MRVVLLFIVFATASWAEKNPVSAYFAENRLEEAAGVCRQYDMLAGSNSKTDLQCAWVYLRTDRLESAKKIMGRLKSASLKPDLELLEIYVMAKEKKYDLAQAGIDEYIKAYRNSAHGHDGEEISGEIYEM